MTEDHRDETRDQVSALAIATGNDWEHDVRAWLELLADLAESG